MIDVTAHREYLRGDKAHFAFNNTCYGRLAGSPDGNARAWTGIAAGSRASRIAPRSSTGDPGQKRRATAKTRQEAGDALVALQGDRALLAAEGQRGAAQAGPARFLAIQLGTNAETVIR